MAKTRQQKEVAVKELTDKLKGVKAVIFANFDGLKANEVNKLRSQCKEQKIDYLVTKKTLLKRALDQVDLKDIDPKNMTGGIVTVLGYEDEVAPAKTLNNFAKDHQTLKIIGGILEKKFVTASVVNDLAQIPSREELLAKAVGSISAPVAGLVNVLKGNLNNLVFVLQAIKDKNNK